MNMAMNPNKALWQKGDFTRIAATMRESGEALVHQLGIGKGMKVLDLGCGDGTTALPAAKLGADVLGVDIASNLVKAGNKRAQEHGFHFQRFQGVASRFNKSDKTLDFIGSNSLRPHKCRIARSNEPGDGQHVAILLALRNEDGLPGGNCGFQFRQSVEHAPHALQIPNPLAGLGRVGAALPKSLRFVPHALEQERAAFISVVVRRHDAAPGSILTGGALRIEVGEFQSHCGRDGFGVAASVTMDQNTTVLPFGDAQTRCAVIVRRTACLRRDTGSFYSSQSCKEFRDVHAASFCVRALRFLAAAPAGDFENSPAAARV